MFKETVTYKDFNGLERTEDFYFNLTQAEVAEMELSEQGGFAEMLKRIVAAQDAPELIKVFKEFLRKSYGVKSPDGRRFDKTPEILQDFEGTEAFSILFMKYAFDDKAAAKFIKGIMPEGFTVDAKNTPKLPQAKK